MPTAMVLALLLSSHQAYAGFFGKSDSTIQVQNCIALLSHERPAFSQEQLQLIIENDLGPANRISELRRDYVRDGKSLVSLTFRAVRESGTVRRSVKLRVVDLDEDKILGFTQVIRRDFTGLPSGPELYPSTDPSRPHSGPARIYQASTGYRHRQTKEESADLFIQFDQILAQRLENYQAQDTVEINKLEDAQVRF